MYQKAVKPTMYFIGVTTTKSSIMTVFPAWAKYLELGDCEIKGIDLKLHDTAENYNEAVSFIKKDPLSLGALVTTHKLDILTACRNQFEELDEYAALMSEMSSISKKDGKLIGHAKDPITSGLSIEAFVPENYWKNTRAEVFILGAGGSAIAVSWYLMKKEHGDNRPSKIIVANRSLPRLEEMKHLHAQLNTGIHVEYVHTPNASDSNEIMKNLKPGSLVINATGMGKDTPGSPLTDEAVFPENGLVWDFNYRGDLVFLDQAKKQQKDRNLTIEDGWVYFLHGWTRVIAEVFHIDIPTSGPKFDKLSEIASLQRK